LWLLAFVWLAPSVVLALSFTSPPLVNKTPPLSERNGASILRAWYAQLKGFSWANPRAFHSYSN
jgi:hypothetical protein